jgi:hypothetical protein
MDVKPTSAIAEGEEEAQAQARREERRIAFDRISGRWEGFSQEAGGQ